MSQTAKWLGLNRFAGLCAVILSAAVLSGCVTPSVQATVTSFQRWPADVVGETYRFVDATPGQANNLEYQSYQDAMRASMGATGLVEAQSNKPARFDVSFSYGSEQTQVMVPQPYDPYFYGGFGGFYGSPFWGGGMWGPSWVDVPTVVYQNRLSVNIFDNAKKGTEVYRASAYTLSARGDLLNAMPYLTRAIFDGFPGNNGSERQVQYPAGL
jgi:hypothetical protein